MHYICNILDWALLLSLWSCLINYFIWAKQTWEETIQLQLGKFFLWGSVLRPLSTTNQITFVYEQRGRTCSSNLYTAVIVQRQDVHRKQVQPAHVYSYVAT